VNAVHRLDDSVPAHLDDDRLPHGGSLEAGGSHRYESVTYLRPGRESLRATVPARWATSVETHQPASSMSGPTASGLRERTIETITTGSSSYATWPA
jgi:hypothetical protein